MDDITGAMDLVNLQIVKKLLVKNNTKMKVALDALDALWLIHEDEIITITGPLTKEIHPKVPSWVTFETDSDKFRIMADANPYAPEIALLLTETWKQMKKDDSIFLEHHVFNALEFLESRWRTGGDPLNEPDQRGLIGEIEAIIHTFAIKGNDAVAKWDHTSHALHDIRGDGWAVEAKSVGESSDTVSISTLDQLKWNKGVKLVLSVTTVSKDESDHGMTLPEYIDERVMYLKSENSDSAKEILLKLQAIGFTDTTRARYSLKWKMPVPEDTSFYLIEKDSPTNWWSDKALSPQKPKEIVVDKYRLDLNSKAFESKPLADILD